MVRGEDVRPVLVGVFMSGVMSGYAVIMDAERCSDASRVKT